jgi:hypothetical protein
MKTENITAIVVLLIIATLLVLGIFAILAKY